MNFLSYMFNREIERRGRIKLDLVCNSKSISFQKITLGIVFERDILKYTCTNCLQEIHFNVYGDQVNKTKTKHDLKLTYKVYLDEYY